MTRAEFEAKVREQTGPLNCIEYGVMHDIWEMTNRLTLTEHEDILPHLINEILTTRGRGEGIEPRPSWPGRGGGGRLGPLYLRG